MVLVVTLSGTEDGDTSSKLRFRPERNLDFVGVVFLVVIVTVLSLLFGKNETDDHFFWIKRRRVFVSGTLGFVFVVSVVGMG